MTLYRQYRPLQFHDLIGQDSVTRTLQNALIQKRVTHAYLLSGPRGTGKTTTARIFARALTCLQPKVGQNSYEPCGECESCTSILENHTQDLVEIDAASNRGIEDIRSLREQVHYPPTRLSHKIYIIDEVHMLTGEAFNALLKTLEEPPLHCIFILATTELHKLPATIRSRCQLLRFERGSIHAIVKKLSEVAKSEDIEVDQKALNLIAEHADGGFRDALTLFEHAITQHTPLTLANTIDLLGITDRDQLNTILELIITGEPTAAIKHLRSSIAATNAKMDRVSAQLIELVREKMSKAKDKEMRYYAALLERLLEAYILQKSSPSPLAPLEIAIAGAPALHGEAVLAERPANQTVSSGSRIRTTSTEATPNVPVLEIRDAIIKDIRRAWRQMVEEISRTTPPLGQMLRETLFHSSTDTTITIHVRYKFHTDKLNEKKNTTLVEELLRDLTGQRWHVTYHLTENMPRRTPRKEISMNGTGDAAEVFGN